VLLVMDWKFTLVHADSLSNVFAAASRLRFKRARKAVQNEQEGMAEMVVTMQETFAGIRVIKSFAREAHQERNLSAAIKRSFPR